MTVSVDDVLSAMRGTGIFYTILRQGLTPALWRKSARGVAPVTESWLQQWIRENVSTDATRDMASTVIEVGRVGISGLPMVNEKTVSLI